MKRKWRGLDINTQHWYPMKWIVLNEVVGVLLVAVFGGLHVVFAWDRSLWPAGLGAGERTALGLVFLVGFAFGLCIVARGIRLAKFSIAVGETGLSLANGETISWDSITAVRRKIIGWPYRKVPCLVVIWKDAASRERRVRIRGEISDFDELFSGISEKCELS